MALFSDNVKMNIKNLFKNTIILWSILLISISSEMAYSQEPFNRDSVMKELRSLKFKNPDSAIAIINTYIEVAKQSEWYVAIADFRHFKTETLIYQGKINEARNHLRENRKLITQWQELVDYNDKQSLTSHNAYTFLGEANIFNRLGKYDSSIWACQNAIQLFKSADRPQEKLDQGVSSTNITLGAAYYYLGKVDTALMVMIENQDVLKRLNDTPNIAIGYANIGTIYRSTGDLSNSLKYLQMGLPIAKEHQYSSLGGILGSMGQVYHELGEYEKALKYGLESLDFANTTDNKFQVGYTANDIGDNYKNLNKPDSADYYYNLALETHKQIDNTIDIAYTYQRKALLSLELNQYNEALILAEEGLKLIGEDMFEEEIRLLDNKAEALYQLKRYSEAQRVVNEIIESVKETDNINILKDVYKISHKVMDVNGDKTKAYQYLLEYVAIRDSVYKKEKTLEVARLEYNFQLKQETEKIEQEKKEQAQQYENELEKEKIIQQWAVVVIVLVIMILLILYRVYRNTKAKNLELSHKNELIESQNEQLQFKNEEITKLRETEKELAEEALALKERELTTSTLLSYEKNNLLERLEDQVGKLSDKVDQKVLPDLKEIKRTIKANLSEESWSTFTYHFETVHPNFFENLKSRFEGLSLNDLKLCAYLKVGLDNKVIARMNNITVAGVKKSINRLKKKIELGPDQDLREMLMSV